MSTHDTGEKGANPFLRNDMPFEMRRIGYRHSAWFASVRFFFVTFDLRLPAGRRGDT